MNIHASNKVSAVVSPIQTSGDPAKGELCFLDTNILLYAIDDRAPQHQEIALNLIDALSRNQCGILSTQVLLEFNANLTGKFRVSRHTAALMTAAYADWTVIESDLTLVLRATARSAEQNYSIWDAMVIEAAIRANATTLYSEDMQHGQRFGALTLVNPFAALRDKQEAK